MALAGPATPSSELAPRLSLKAPSHLLHVLEDFDEGVRMDAPNTALKAMRQAFAMLLGVSADILGAACVQMGASAELYMLEKGQVARLSDSESRVKEALFFLSQNDSGELGKECAGIFFDSSGSPRQFYLLTQGGKVEGIMGGLYRISDFCKEPTRAPGRSESFRLRNAYLPHLEAWLQALNSFWEKSELIWERTTLDGEQRVLYRVYDTELEVGQRIQLNECKACIPSRVLVTPADWVQGEGFLGIPQEVPEHALHLADRFGLALEARDTIESTRLLRDSLEFLLRYFAGVGKLLCQELNCLTEDAQKFARKSEEIDSCERLLQECVECLKSHQDDTAAKDFVGVFYRRDIDLELQPRSHTNILLLEGVLSSWFTQERGQTPSADRYAKDYERYFPLFRDWVRSMGPYFSHTENFSDPPTEHGFLPLTVRAGEHLLELIDPEYLLRIRQCPVCLPNPIWMRQQAEAVKKKAAGPSLSAAELLRRRNALKEDEPSVLEIKPDEPPVVKDTPGEFRPIDIPSDSPNFLGRVLRRLDIRLRRGELSQSREALRDALDYLLRYWTGACFVCARDAGQLSIDEEERASQNLGIPEYERLLHLCLQKLGSQPNELSAEIIQVFYERDLFTEQLKPVGSHARLLLTDAGADNQMQLLAEFCEVAGTSDVHRARRDLKTFLPVLRDWLAASQNFFAQCQHHEEDPDKQGLMELVIQWDKIFIELVAPDFAFHVLPGSDLVPDLEVPEWVEPKLEKGETSALKPKVITTEELALSEPFLIHKVQYVGIQSNSQGVSCKSGIISVQNAGGGSLTGRAFSNHPCIEVSPNRFRDKSQLQYWLNEATIPRDFVPYLVLRSGGDERQVSLAELRPLSTFSTMSKPQALVLTYSPAVGLWMLVNALIVYEVQQMRSELAVYQNMNPLPPEAVPIAANYGSIIGGVFLLYPVVATVGGLLVFRRFSHSLQDLIGKHFSLALGLPGILLIVSCAINSLVFPELRNVAINSLNLFKLTPWGIAFAVAASVYCNLEYERKFAEWIQDSNMRRIVAPIFVAVFFILWTLALY